MYITRRRHLVRAVWMRNFEYLNNYALINNNSRVIIENRVRSYNITIVRTNEIYGRLSILTLKLIHVMRMRGTAYPRQASSIQNIFARGGGGYLALIFGLPDKKKLKFWQQNWINRGGFTTGAPSLDGLPPQIMLMLFHVGYQNCLLQCCT